MLLWFIIAQLFALSLKLLNTAKAVKLLEMLWLYLMYFSWSDGCQVRMLYFKSGNSSNNYSIKNLLPSLQLLGGDKNLRFLSLIDIVSARICIICPFFSASFLLMIQEVSCYSQHTLAIMYSLATVPNSMEPIHQKM